MSKTYRAAWWFIAGMCAVMLFSVSVSADEGAQVSQPDYGFRWGEKGCRKKFPVGCGRYWPAPPLKCKYIRWGCPIRSDSPAGEEE